MYGIELKGDLHIINVDESNNGTRTPKNDKKSQKRWKLHITTLACPYLMHSSRLHQF